MDAEASHRTKGLLRLTMACNERCPFCNVPVEDYPRPTPPEADTAAELDAFVATGEQTLTISGGEPTLLRGRLLRLVAAARARGVRFVELQTNAVLIDAAYAGELVRAGLSSAFVSLLSDDPTLHDRLAGLEGAWPRCVAGIDALLDAGVRVTLNPVTATDTQERLPAYVDFVASRLPRVRSISVSVVQPHGRAATNLDLLPDYARLGPAVRAARRRAAEHGIELLNPYCGLPLCVGWEDGMDASVEAVEARGGGWRGTPGIENRGDKRQGPGCRDCALRARCGGAWHAYWDARGGSGLVPPALTRGPYDPGPRETVIRAPGGPTAATWSAVRARVEPFVWVWTDAFVDTEALIASGAGGLVLAGPVSAETMRGVYRVRGRVAVWLVVPARDARIAAELAAKIGLEAVVLTHADSHADPARLAAIADALQARFGVRVMART